MKNTFYITTAIAYSNDDPHLGHAYEFFIADVIARYWRQKGVDTYFLTGMDEHGSKIARKAKEEGIGAQAFVDSKAESFKELHALLGISYDGFIRTSDKEAHWSGAQALWKKMHDAGDIYKKTYEGLYCVGCEKFLTEKDLVEGKCPLHSNREPERVKEENWFFRLSNYAETLKEKITKGELVVSPLSAKSEMLALIDEGLHDVSFSRAEDAVLWGIPVPEDQSQLMYVWCDALANYVTALGYGKADDALFKKFWPADAHVIGKDITRFHVLFWPAMLLSAGLPLPHSVIVHGFITRDGKKMSKSLGNGVDPKALLRDFGTPAVRYYFGREFSIFDDSDFSYERFTEAYNANLANGLGNLLSRTLKMVETYAEGKIVAPKQPFPVRGLRETIAETNVVDLGTVSEIVLGTIRPQYDMAMEAFEINKASDRIWELVALLDRYIADYEPYKLVKTDKDATHAVLWSVLCGIHHIADMLVPFLPETAKTIKKHIGATGDETTRSFATTALDVSLFPRREEVSEPV